MEMGSEKMGVMRVGYVRVSKKDQNPELQRAALTAAGTRLDRDLAGGSAAVGACRKRFEGALGDGGGGHKRPVQCDTRTAVLHILLGGPLLVSPKAEQGFVDDWPAMMLCLRADVLLASQPSMQGGKNRL